MTGWLTDGLLADTETEDVLFNFNFILYNLIYSILGCLYFIIHLFQFNSILFNSIHYLFLYFYLIVN